MRESLLQVSTRCLHTQLKAGPEKAPVKTTVEARKVYPESAEGFTLSLPKGGLFKTTHKLKNSPGQEINASLLL